MHKSRYQVLKIFSIIINIDNLATIIAFVTSPRANGLGSDLFSF